ncbi:ras-related protein Rab-32B-like isoform X2 [Pomacea canaliculata]|uniref:ras-related protein Rab-32B-like isoform X2 n=1 Tax=Pomacea canaliculata TaxID=400727 RepID=UPI000D735BEC|nr:ras-related protein Rab-32B-like isoform X2 [Pomacea canaliculata]
MAAASAATKPLVQEHLYKVLVIGEFGVGGRTISSFSSRVTLMRYLMKMRRKSSRMCALMTHKQMTEKHVLDRWRRTPGKTSIIRRYTEGYFSPNYKLTIGVDFALKSIDWNESTKVSLQLWDIAGHERFGHMTRVYYKYAIAAIVVFDLSRPATFDAVIKWLDDVNSKVMLANEQPVPVLLLANKSDIEEVSINKEQIDKFCKEHKFIAWFPTSAKTNTNIDEAMNFLVKFILDLPEESHLPAPDRHSLPNSLVSSMDNSYTRSLTDKDMPKRWYCCS